MNQNQIHYNEVLMMEMRRVELFLCLTKHHAMKTYGGVELQIHAFITSALDGGEWSASRPGRFTPGNKARYTLDRWLAGWTLEPVWAW